MKMTFRLIHGKIDFLCTVNELVTEILLSLCMLSDYYMFLGICPPTPSLGQHFALSEKYVLM